MKLLINYADNVFIEQQKMNSESGLKLGLFDKVISYSPKNIEPDFFKKNIKFLIRKKAMDIGSGSHIS